MGFLDKLKSVGKMITGGGAKVYVEIPAVQLGETFTVKIKAVVAEGDLKIDGVYLLIQAEERVEVDGSKVYESIREKIKDFAADGRLDGITQREETCDIKVNVTGPDTLKSGETYEWEGTVDLPSGSLPTYHGRNSHHVWQLQAGLDAFGNDPDSGWVEFTVR